MIRIDPNRMIGVTEARQGFNQLVSDAKDGAVSHIVSGGKLLAHVVPPDLPFIDDPWRHACLLDPAIEQEVEWAASEAPWCDGRLDYAGDTLGRILGWAWQTDPDLFVNRLGFYVAKLSERVGRHLDLDSVAFGLRRALTVVLFRGEDEAAIDYARARWSDWSHPAPQQDETTGAHPSPPAKRVQITPPRRVQVAPPRPRQGKTK